MKRTFLIIITLFVAACAHESPLATRFPGLPRDAAKVADRIAMCQHFGGEINGDGSERDKEVFRAMTSLRCGTIDHDESVIRRKYAGNPQVLAALAAAAEQ